MSNFKKTFLAAPFMVAALSIGAFVPASAQDQNVEVTISPDVADLIAVDLNIEDNQIIDDVIANAVVQAPIGIAANVCPQFNAAALAQEIQQEGSADCTAETNTRAFSQLVQRQLDL